MCTQLTSAKQLLEIFPYLPVRSKFRKAIDMMLKATTPVYIGIAEPFKSFRSTTGKTYRYKIGQHLFGRTRVQSTVMSEKMYLEMQSEVRNVEFGDYGSSTMLIGKEEIVSKYTVRCERQEVDSIGWAYLALYISKVIKNDSVFVNECGKCSGTGFIPQFAHVAEGVCFDCGGIGKWPELNTPTNAK